MYRIVETHLDIETGKLKDVTPISKNFGREEYKTYEECVERIEEFLVPHSIELGIFYDEVDYNKGTEVNYAFGKPVQWKVLRSVAYHTIFTIEKI